MKSVNESGQKFNEQFIHAFANAVLETLKILCKIEAQWSIENANQMHVKPREIMATIPLVSSSLNGRVVLSLEKPIFLSLMSRMQRKTYTELESEISDGVAELLNIIFGTAKRLLNENGYDIKIAIPELIAENCEHSHLAMNKLDAQSNQHAVLTFTMDDGTIFLNLVIHK